MVFIIFFLFGRNDWGGGGILRYLLIPCRSYMYVYNPNGKLMELNEISIFISNSIKKFSFTNSYSCMYGGASSLMLTYMN